MQSLPESPNAHNPLLSLPPELHGQIFEFLGFPPVSLRASAEYATLAALEKTCRQAQRITEPYLYYKIYTCVRNAPWHPDMQESGRVLFSTASLVDLLERRPHLQRMVHALVLDEYDPMYFSRLLRLRLQKLDKLVCHHERGVEPAVDTVYTEVAPQSKLSYCTSSSPLTSARASIDPSVVDLSIQKEPGHPLETYDIGLSEVPIFDQASLKFIRLSYLDLSELDRLPAECFAHTELRELRLEHCDYTLPALTRLLQPSKSLTRLYLHFEPFSPFRKKQEIDFILHLQSIAGDTLEALKLIWRVVIPELEPWPWPGWNLSKFTALECLHVCPSSLRPARGDFTPERLSCALPPRIKMLALDDFSTIVTPVAGVGTATNILEALIAYKSQGSVPYLTHVIVFHEERPTRLPREWVREARNVGISLRLMRNKYPMNLGYVDMEWLHMVEEMVGPVNESTDEDTNDDEDEDESDGEDSDEDPWDPGDENPGDEDDEDPWDDGDEVNDDQIQL